MKAQTITILGLERTGASIGLALKASHLDVVVVGYDESRTTMQEAKEAGAVDKTQWRLVRAAAGADIIIIAMAASGVEHALQSIGDYVQEHTLLLGLSQLKATTQEWADRYLRRGHYVGAVPILRADTLADGTRGVAGASADLFHDSLFCLMPSAKADPKAVETAVNLGTVLGAKPFFLDPAEYDSLVQGVQTIPGLAAAALFQAVTEAPGWRDILRFADLPFAQATASLQDEAEIALLALSDQAATLRWLDALLSQLQELRRWVAEGDKERMTALLEKLNGEREKWLRERAENDWQEGEAVSFAPMGMTERMLGWRPGKEKE